MFRTPANKNMADEKEVVNEERAGPSHLEEISEREFLVEMVETIEVATIKRQDPKTPPMVKRPEDQMKDETPKRPAAQPKLKPPVKANTYTITKKAASAETPSPIKSPKTAREVYPNRMAEARAVHKKGVENLERFKNLRASVKVEVRKALDRLYALVNDGPAVRNLEKQIRDDAPPTKPKDLTEVTSQTENWEKRLEKHAALLTRNTKAMEQLKTSLDRAEELKSTLQEHKRILEDTTYARVAATKPMADKKNDRATLHSVIVSSKNDQNTGEQVLEEVRKAINAKEGWIRIEKVRKAKDRKVVVGCSTIEERKKIKERLEKTGQHLIVEEVRNRDPMIAIKDVLSSHTDEEVMKALKNQNREIFQGLDDGRERAEIKFRKKARNPHTCHIVLVVSPAIWRRAVDTGRMRIDLQKVYVEDQTPLVQCSRCLGYGHSRRFCKDSEDLCSHCGGPHLNAKCPDRGMGEAPDCLNCKRAAIDNRSHNAFNKDCPVRRKWDAIARASVSYC